MKVQRGFIAAGMDMDSSHENIEQNDLIKAFNARSLGTDEGEAGCITSIEGNQLVPHPLPTGRNLCVGAKSFDGANKAYYWLWNEFKNHRIEEYDYESNTIFTIFENITNSGGEDILKLDSGSFVKDIELVDNRFLKWNEAVTSPKELDIQRIKDNEYGVITWFDIEQIKAQPMTPIKVRYIDDMAMNSNSLSRRLFQFRYKYIYWNNEESAFSEYSRREVPTDETTPSSVADVSKNNAQVLTLKVGSNRVREVAVSARYDNLAWQEIKRVTMDHIRSVLDSTIDLGTEKYESFDPVTGEYSFIFYNKGIFEYDDLLEGDLYCDMLPDKAGSMKLANGNVMLFGDITEGSVRPKTKTQLDVTYYDPQISIQPTDMSNAMTSKFSQMRPNNTHRRRVTVEFFGKPRSGDRIQMFVQSMENYSNIQQIADHTVSPAEEAANDLGAIIYAITNGYYKFQWQAGGAEYARFQFMTTSMWVFGWTTITYANKTSGLSKSVPALKSNSAYPLALAYRKEFGKPMPLQSRQTVNTRSIAQTGGMLPQIDWQILDQKAPEGAVDYQWVLSPNNTHQRFLQINGKFINVPAGETSYIDISLKSILKFNKANPSSLITYDFAAGDRCTFISRYMDGENPTFFSTKSVDVDVISFKPVPTSDEDPTTTDYVLRIRRPVSIDPTGVYDGGDNLTGKEIVIEIYTPKNTADGEESQVYYEVGEVYPIDSDGNHTVMSGSIKEIDNYFKTREMEFASEDNKFAVFEVEDANFSDFYKSNYYSFGRPRSYFDTPELVNLKASVRYSDTFNKFTNNNGLNRFYASRLVDYDEIYGAIRYLEQRDNVVIAVQEQKVGYIPINQSIIEDQAGSQNVAVSDTLLNQIRYSKGINIGIGNAIRSFASYGSNVYFIDPNRCEPVRVGLDGVVSISKKMSKYFKKVIRDIYKAGKDIAGFYDVFNNEYIITFTTVDQQTITITIDDANWRVIDNYVVDPAVLSVPYSQTNGTTSYDFATGIATFTPADGFYGSAGIRFSFPTVDGTVERGECIEVEQGERDIDPIDFMDQIDVPLSEWRVSNLAIIQGNNIPQSLTINTGQLQLNNDGVWRTGSVIVSDGDVIQLRVMSSASYGTLTYAEILVNSAPVRFNVTTLNRTFPDPFGFDPIVDANLNELYPSNVISPVGNTVPVAISIDAGEYRVNGGAWVSSAGTFPVGGTVQVRRTSSAVVLTEIITTLTIGGVSGTFSITTKDVPPPPECPDRALVFQMCNENSSKDDNFDVFLNDVQIGSVNFNADAQIGSVFIASLDEPEIVSADFACPLGGMVAYYFDPALVVGGINVIKMINTETHDNGNYGTVGIRNYEIIGDELSNPCVVDNLTYSGVTGANFTLEFNYTACCPEDEEG